MMQEYWFGGEFSAFHAEIVNMAGPARYAQGEVLNKQGEDGGQVFYIAAGAVEVSRIHATGKKYVYGFHSTGSICALDCLVKGEEPIVSISATNRVTAHKLSRADVFALMSRNPEFACRLAEHYCSVLRFVCNAMVELTCGDAMSQVAGFLFHYAETTGFKPDSRLAMSQDEVASLVSISRVQVARVYRRLRGAGIIRTGRNYVELMEPAKLESYCI